MFLANPVGSGYGEPGMLGGKGKDGMCINAQPMLLWEAILQGKRALQWDRRGA